METPYPLPGTRLYDRVTPVKENPDWRYENENRLVFQSEFDEGYLKERIDSVNILFKFFKIQSTMIPKKSFGYCRVLYQAKNLQLKISVTGPALKPPDQLILLNEVPGIDFTRMIIFEKNGGKIFNGDDFLPWQTCPIETAVENPGLHIGFFIASGKSETVEFWRRCRPGSRAGSQPGVFHTSIRPSMASTMTVAETMIKAL